MSDLVVQREQADAEGFDTLYTLSEGQIFDGATAVGADVDDPVRLRVENGQTYTLTLTPDNDWSYTDLQLFDADENFVVNGARLKGSATSKLIFTAPETTELYALAGFVLFSEGDYQLAFEQTEDLTPWTLSQITDYLTTGFAEWFGEVPAKWDLSEGNGGKALTYDARALGPAGEDAAAMAFRAWTDVSGITFTPTTGRADITFTQNDDSAFANHFERDGIITGATINMYASDYGNAGTFLPADYEVLLHEIGHALGLGHAGPYNFEGYYEVDALHTADTVRTSVMSYFRVFQEAFTTLYDAQVLTPMTADILAIRELYGTPQMNLGDTIYGPNADISDVAQLPDGLLGSYSAALQDLLGEGIVERNIQYLYTIWDDGGVDTIDLARANVAKDIDLSIADAQSTTTADRNIVLAPGTIIENAIGSAFDDVIFGNRVANALTGNGGDDMLIGGMGGDMLSGGDGADVLFGEGRSVVVDLNEYNQIYRLYQAILDRVPDAAGHADWTRQLADDQRSLSQVASLFVASREFNNVFGTLDTDAFVTLLYENVLGRAPDTGGFATWTGALDAGQTRANVVLGFSESQEFIKSTAPAASATVKAQTAQFWTDDVFRLYQATLDRAPDMGGFISWTTALAADTALEEVATGFTQSTEFQNTYGATDNTQFVQLLYANVLDRAGDTAEVDGWLTTLNNGQSRAEVVLGFSQSQEFQASTFEALDDWVDTQGPDDTLQGGSGVDALIGGILSDTFVFDAAAGQRGQQTTVFDLEAWDTLSFQGFSYESADQIRANMTLSGGDVVFADQAVTAIFKDTTLGFFTDDMFAF